MKVSFDITEVSFRTFIKILSIYSVDGNNLTVLINDSNIGNSKSFIEQKYGLFLRVAIEQITGVRYDISYISSTDFDTQNEAETAEPEPSATTII